MNLIYKFLGFFLVAFGGVYFTTRSVLKILQNSSSESFSDSSLYQKLPIKHGGLIIFSIFTVFFLYLNINIKSLLNIGSIGFILSALLIAFTGYFVDKFSLKPFYKIVGTTVAALILIFSNHFQDIVKSSGITVFLMVLWIIIIVVAFNGFDNMDGLAIGVATSIALGFYLILLLIGKTVESRYLSLLQIVFVGLILGFLPYNFSPAKIILGSAGSMFIGYFLSVIGIFVGKYAAWAAHSKVFVLIPILMLSYVIFDFAFVMITRWRNRKKIDVSIKDHTTHRVGNLIGSTRGTAFIIYLINALMVFGSLYLIRIGSRSFLLFSFVLIAVLYVMLGIKISKIPFFSQTNIKRGKI